MYFHFYDHVYCCIYQNSAIILDIKQDNYFILAHKETRHLENILKTKFVITNGQYKPDTKLKNFHAIINTLNDLIKNKLGSCKQTPFQRTINKNTLTEGMPNIDWRLPQQHKPIHNLFQNVCLSLVYLTYVHLSIRIFGLYFLIRKLQRLKPMQPLPFQIEDIENLQTCLNKACKLFPLKTKCLEWAITLTLIGLKRKWPLNLIIGVQNYPFGSHAWVEVQGKIIGDDPTLRKNLAVVLEEPFGNQS